MVTWTTYGSWLQGDRRGYVKNGRILPGDKEIEQANRRFQKSSTVKLNSQHKDIVRQAILCEAKRIGQKIEALAVCESHVHLVARPYKESIEEIVSRYKNISMFALHKYIEVDRIWTHGFDKRFCFDPDSLNQRIEYVNIHQFD
jgi:REP element-mobilizing transposase RayT